MVMVDLYLLIYQALQTLFKSLLNGMKLNFEDARSHPVADWIINQVKHRYGLFQLVDVGVY